jgi:plasmid maintenance system antidote protein VapI
MLPENRIPNHPGEILKDEFLEPLRLTQVAFAAHLGISTQ